MPTANTPENRTALGDYFARDPRAKRYTRLLFRSERGAQSAEMNDMQALVDARLKAFGDSLYNDGKIIAGSQPSVLAPSHQIKLESGTIYLKGNIYGVMGATLTIPWNAKVFVGIQYRELIITEVDDIELRDPAPYSENAGEPGAARVQSEYVWGWQADNGTNDGKTSPPWEFFPIYTVDHGVLVVESNEGPDPTIDLIAKYDREAHGNYVVNGLIAAFLSETNSTSTVVVSSGLADIFGYKIERRNDERFVFNKDFDTRVVQNEFHTFNPDSTGKCQIWPSNFPVSDFGEISGVARVADLVTHIVIGPPQAGMPAGDYTEIHPTRSIQNIVSVVKAGITYIPGTDYTRQGKYIRWINGGNKPAAGETYSLTYDYSVQTQDGSLVPVESTAEYIVLSGLVPGSSVVIDDYQYKLPRVDLLVMNRDGSLERIKGVPQLRNPSAPKPAQSQIAIAELSHDWVNPVTVRNTSIRAIHFDELKQMGERIEDLYDLQAQNELRFNTVLEDPTSKLGVFVDAFHDDDMRDQGLDQNASIIDGILTLPIVPQLATTSNTADLEKYITLPFQHDVVILQNRKTGCMKINPYQAFEPIPAKITLTPPIDIWTEFQTEFTSPATRYFWAGTQGKGSRSKVVTQTRRQLRVIGRESVAVQFCRVRNVGFTIEGFGPGETLTELTFDGVNITPA